MRPEKLRTLAAGVLVAVSFASTPTRATEKAGDAPPSPEACRKNVRAMGASMGEAEEKAAAWGLAYHFVIRTDGIDYDVLCDAKTGLVKDVARRGGTAQSQ